jgi:hypothetical protein
MQKPIEGGGTVFGYVFLREVVAYILLYLQNVYTATTYSGENSQSKAWTAAFYRG